MELKQFVEEALLNITDGVKKANTKQNRFRVIGIMRNDSGIDGSYVEFDVSVVVEQKLGSKIRGGIGASILNVVSAKFDSKIEGVDSHQNVNRLKFKVWVSENEL